MSVVHRFAASLVLAAASVVTTTASVASADTLWIGEGANPIKAEGVKVQKVEGDKLTYTTQSGVSSSKTFSQLQLINVDGETGFNAGETAFARQDMSGAAAGYQSALQSSSKDWIQMRAGMRLVQVAKQLKRYDTEVAAYTAVLTRDPAAAANAKPEKPAADSQYLDPALASVSKALTNPKLDKTQQSSLLGLQLDIYRAKKDVTNVNAVLQQLSALGGGDPAVLKLAAANVAYDAKQYAQAVNTIEQNRAIFTQPDQQVDALWVLAQAKDAVDGDKTDTATLQDLALRYMRVVAFGSQLPEAPHVPEAMLAAAKLQEKLQDKPAALQLYQQIEKKFPTSPVVAEAKTGAARTKG